jgi:hypothetical protein
MGEGRRLVSMSETRLPTPFPGYARFVRCLHVFILFMLRYELGFLWCRWCHERRPGTQHGHEDPVTCECRRLAR